MGVPFICCERKEKGFDLSDTNICYFFDSGFYGNHVRNAFNAVSLPSGAIVVYKYRIDPKNPQASTAIVHSFREKYKSRDNKHKLCLLIIVDRYHKGKKGTEFAYHPFRYGEVLNIVDEGDDYVYVYIKLLHFVRLKDCNKAAEWLSLLAESDINIYPPSFKDEVNRNSRIRGHSVKYAYDFKKNTLTIKDLFEQPQKIHDDAGIWNKIIWGVDEERDQAGVPDRDKTDGLADIHFFEAFPHENETSEATTGDSFSDTSTTSPSEKHTNLKNSRLFFYRFHISEAFGSAKEVDPKIDSFTIGDDSSTNVAEFRKGYDYHYNFKLNKKYAIVLQCCFPAVKLQSEREAVYIVIKLGNVKISDQIYSDFISTQRIVFSINRRQFLEHSTGQLTIKVSSVDNTKEKPEAFIFCAPSTVIKYEVKKGFRDNVVKSIPISSGITLLLTAIDVFKATANSPQLFFNYLQGNWPAVLFGAAINFVMAILLVYFTKRDLI